MENKKQLKPPTSTYVGQSQLGGLHSWIRWVILQMVISSQPSFQVLDASNPTNPKDC